MTHFNTAFAVVVGLEGGYVNDPRDPGGETKYGISKRAHPTLDIFNLTLEAAKETYLNQYWLPAHCDDLPWPLCLLVFDGAVNQGTDATIKLLQKASNTVQDGILGKNTLIAIGRSVQKDLCARFMAHRAKRYIGTRNFDTYGDGWFYRLFCVALETNMMEIKL